MQLSGGRMSKQSLRIDPQVIKLSNTTFRCQSFHNPLENYKVENRRGIWVCECPNFLWRCAGKNVDCSHIRLIKLRHPEALKVKFRQAPAQGRMLSEMI